MPAFVDPNVLLYFVSTTASEASSKRSTARAILDRDDLVLSAQVLQEFYVQATRITKPAGVVVENPFAARAKK